MSFGRFSSWRRCSKKNGVDESGDDENNVYGEVQCTQEQQKVLANNWRATILENMWTDAMNMLKKKKKKDATIMES